MADLFGYFFTIVLTIIFTALVAVVIGTTNTNDRLRQEIKKLEKRD
jgi:hypothetical protein